MDIGTLPGFYYDADKKKYFRVQPDHKVPAHVKYSSQQIQEDTRARKRAKQAHLLDSKKMRSRLSTLSAGRGTNASLLLRESGHYSNSMARQVVDRAFVSSLAYTDFSGGWPRRSIFAAYELPVLDGLLMQVGPNLLFRSHSNDTTQLVASQVEPRSCTNLTVSTRVYTHAATNVPICIYNIHQVAGTLRWSSLALGSVTSLAESPSLAHSAQLTGYNARFTDIAVSPEGRLAIAADALLFCATPGAAQVQTFGSKNAVNAIDWLSQNVIVSGQKKGVHLWDLRVRQSRKRIDHEARITGVRSIKSSNGAQIMVSDNNGMKLYDLRMTSTEQDRAPLCFSGIFEGTHSIFDISADGLLAAYMDSEIKIFSLSSGELLRSIGMPSEKLRSTAMKWCDIHQFIWHEDRRGAPVLQICIKDSIFRLSPNDEPVLRWNQHIMH